MEEYLKIFTETDDTEFEVRFGTVKNNITNETEKVKNELACSIYSLALEDKVHNIIGDQDYLRKINKIDNKSITDFIIKIFNK